MSRLLPESGKGDRAHTMLAVLLCLFFQAVQETGCFRLILLQAGRADRSLITVFGNGKRPGCNRGRPFAGDSDGIRHHWIICDLNRLPGKGNADVILPSVKGKASGFIDLTGLMMQERLSDDAAVKVLVIPPSGTGTPRLS